MDPKKVALAAVFAVSAQAAPTDHGAEGAAAAKCAATVVWAKQEGISLPGHRQDAPSDPAAYTAALVYQKRKAIEILGERTAVSGMQTYAEEYGNMGEDERRLQIQKTMEELCSKRALGRESGPVLKPMSEVPGSRAP